MRVGIIKEPSFEADLKSHFDDIKRADEAIDGLEWVLGRKPDIGTPVPGTMIRAIPIFPDNYCFLVYYKLDEESLSLLSIRPVDEEVGFF